jgi:hypothetical protein
VRTLIALAHARQRMGDVEVATDLGERASSRARATGWDRLAAVAEINLAYCELLTGRPVEARQRSERALADAGDNACAEIRLAGLETVARASIELGDLARARATVDEALTLLERPSREGLSIEEASGLRSANAWWAETLEQDLAVSSVTRAPAESPERRRAIERGFEACGAWKQRALREILALRRGAALPRTATVSADEVRAALPSTATVLIEYAIGSRRLLAYVLTSQDLTLVDLGPREPLEELTRRYLAAISEPTRLGTAAEVARLGNELYRGILAPALDVLDDPAQTLVVVPTTDLAALPFEALVCDLAVPAAEVRDLTQVEFVLDRQLVTYAPSTPALVELARAEPHAASARALLLGDPLYPGEAVQHGELLALRGHPTRDPA